MYALIHSSGDWLFAGLIVFIGIVVFSTRIMNGHIVSSICSAAVWLFVYSLHSGSTQGIMTATFAALLFDIVGIPLITLFTRRKT